MSCPKVQRNAVPFADDISSIRTSLDLGATFGKECIEKDLTLWYKSNDVSP